MNRAESLFIASWYPVYHRYKFSGESDFIKRGKSQYKDYIMKNHLSAGIPWANLGVLVNSNT